MATTVEIKIEGLSALDGKLSNLPREVQQAVQEGLMAVAQIAANEAKDLVRKGPKSGRIYEKTNPKRTHQASAPGQPPATDLGALLGSIVAEPAPEALAANLVARMPYAVHLEYGTTRILPRPFMRPAADKASAQSGPIMKAYLAQVFPG